MDFLAACKIHYNMEMGECVAKSILELEPANVAAYVLLPNINAASGNRHLQTAEKGKRC
jgi:hypothetical protein